MIRVNGAKENIDVDSSLILEIFIVGLRGHITVSGSLNFKE
jgi:hypothetical protein